MKVKPLFDSASGRPLGLSAQPDPNRVLFGMIPFRKRPVGISEHLDLRLRASVERYNAELINRGAEMDPDSWEDRVVCLLAAAERGLEAEEHDGGVDFVGTWGEFRPWTHRLRAEQTLRRLRLRARRYGRRVRDALNRKERGT